MQIVSLYLVRMAQPEPEPAPHVAAFPTREEAESLIASRLGPLYKPADFYVEPWVGNTEVH